MRMFCAITVDVEGDYWNTDSATGVTNGLPLILDLFKRLEIKGVFFWTAQMAKNHPEILTRVIDEGHEIGCHGLCHEDFSVLTEIEQAKVIHEAASTLRSFGVDCKGFRAPRLRVNSTLFRVLSDHGFSYDSSIPFWGIRRYTYQKRFDNQGLQELKCIPSYAFRMFHGCFRGIVSRSFHSLGYIVFFLHPWEIIKQPEKWQDMPLARRLNIINTHRAGPSFLSHLESYLIETKEQLHLQTCAELLETMERELSGLNMNQP